MRVRSACKASTSRSVSSRACSRKSCGMPVGRASPGPCPTSTTGWSRCSRCSISRTPVRYSSSRRRSVVHELRPWFASAWRPRPRNRECCTDSLRASSCVHGVGICTAGRPNSRSNEQPRDGLVSLLSGVVGVPPREIGLVGTAVAVVADARAYGHPRSRSRARPKARRRAEEAGRRRSDRIDTPARTGHAPAVR